MNKDYLKPDEIIKNVLDGVIEDDKVTKALAGMYLVRLLQETIGLLSLSGGLSPKDIFRLMGFLDTSIKNLPDDKRVFVEKVISEMTVNVMAELMGTFAAKLSDEQQVKIMSNLKSIPKA